MKDDSIPNLAKGIFPDSDDELIELRNYYAKPSAQGIPNSLIRFELCHGELMWRASKRNEASAELARKDSDKAFQVTTFLAKVALIIALIQLAISIVDRQTINKGSDGAPRVETPRPK